LHDCSAGTHADSGDAAGKKTPRHFVQEFYDWYTPVAQRENAVRGWEIALKVRRSAFSHELVTELKEDLEVQSNCKETVGIDFDPFLNSQDPAQHYEVAEIRQDGRVYRAEVYGVQSGERGKKPDVIAEFTEKAGHFNFVNFHYPEADTNLLAILIAPKPKCSALQLPRKRGH
jgi:hypothetical protein